MQVNFFFISDYYFQSIYRYLCLETYSFMNNSFFSMFAKELFLPSFFQRMYVLHSVYTESVNQISKKVPFRKVYH